MKRYKILSQSKRLISDELGELCFYEEAEEELKKAVEAEREACIIEINKLRPYIKLFRIIKCILNIRARGK